MNDCGHIDDVGAYVLGALAAGEEAAFHVHLDGCVHCRRELTELQRAADALPLSVAQVAPSPGLKDRIMVIVRSEAELLAAAGPEADRAPAAPAPSRERRRRFAWLGGRPLAIGLACAVLVVAAIGSFAVLGGGQTRTVPANVTVASAPAASAKLVVDGDHAKLVVRNLPKPGAGKVYQLWLSRKGTAPQPSTALFSVDRDGAADVAVPESVSGVQAVLVTPEDGAGATTPSTDPIINAPTHSA